MFTVKNQETGAAGPFRVTVLGFPTYTATADSLNQVTESNELNNVRTAVVIC